MKKELKKLYALVLAICLVFTSFTGIFAANSGFVPGNGSFCLLVCAEGEAVVAPSLVTYEEGQTVKQALLSSEISFGGLEEGFIYSVEGVGANYSLFYDGGGYALDVPASEISALCLTDMGDCYSVELLQLIILMTEYRLMSNNVSNYPPAQSAYNAALMGACDGASGEVCATFSTALSSAIADYESMLSGEKYLVTFNVSGQSGEPIEGFTLKLTDAYGNVSFSDSPQIEVIAGTYDFVVSSGHNRTEGSIAVEGADSVSVTLPSKDWYGSIRVLDDGSYVPYEQNANDHTATYYVDDVSSNLAINPIAARGIPSTNDTYLYKIYTGIDGVSVEQRISWASSTNSLENLLCRGMEGNTSVLEARYTGADGFVMIQTYALSFVRVPTLASLKVKDFGGADLMTGFAPKTTSYSIALPIGSYSIEGTAFSGDGYSVSVNGLENGAFVDIAEGSNSVSVTVVHTNGQSRTYTLNINGIQAASVSFDAPSDTSCEVYTMADTLLSPGQGGFYALVPGEQYYYVATKDVYFHATEAFIASDGFTVHVAEPDTADALEAFCFYDNSSVAIREEYAPDTEFISSTHIYTYVVPASAGSLYAQATAASKYSARAEYTDQYILVPHSVEITAPVDGSGVAVGLSLALNVSGYSQTVTVLLDKTENGVTYSQEYCMLLGRMEQIRTLSLSLTDGDLQLYDADGSSTAVFDRDVTEYTIKPQRNVELLMISGNVPYVNSGIDQFKGGFSVDINGETIDNVTNEFTANVVLDPSKEEEIINICVDHIDEYSVPTVYTINVRKQDPVAISFDTDPSDAIVFVKNNVTGKTIYRQNGVFYMTPGEEHSITVTRNGYVGVTQSYVAPQMDASFSISLVQAAENDSLKDLDAYWPYFRADENNNGVVDVKTPISSDDTFLSWAVQLGEGYSGGATGCPILVDGYLYVYASNYIIKVDTISGEVMAQGEMDRTSSFAINTPTYAEGMIFVGLSSGGVQAFNADTLESLWIYNDPSGGQPNCPISYYDGYIYTGFWIGEDKDGSYVCLSVTDEDPSDPKEEKLATWSYQQKGGFYWAGASVCDDFLLVGTDDGEQGYIKGFANVLSLDPKNGTPLDILNLGELGDNHFGDLRCSITYDTQTGDFYFNTKFGYFYRMSVNAEGKIDHEGVRSVRLTNYENLLACPPMSTSTPCIYNGRAYIGVSGTSQFGQYSGHNITVIDLSRMKIAYTVRTQGYPQTSGLLTNAYDEGDGTVYVYFLDNMTPGKLRFLSDRPGQTAPSEVVVEEYTDSGSTKYYDTAPILFTPAGEQAQFVICSPINDEYGNIYFKNDSACLMCLSNTITRLEVTHAPYKTQYITGECFDPSGMKVTAIYSNGASRDVTDYVIYSNDPLTKDDTEFEIRFPYAMYQDKNGEAGALYDAPVAVIDLSVRGEDEVLAGDINLDGMVDEQDVTLIIGHVLGTDLLTDPDRKAAADMNGDGYVDENDVTLLIQIVLRQ